MAISQADITAIVDGLKNTFLGPSAKPTNETPTERASRARNEQILKDNSSALKYLKDTLRKNNSLIENMNYITKASNKVFNEAVDSMSDLKSLEKLPDNFKKIMERSGSSLIKSMAQSADTIEGMFASQQKIEKLPQVKELMQAFVDGSETLHSLQVKIEDLGYTQEEAESIVKRFNSAIISSEHEIKKNTASIALGQKTVDGFDEEIRIANDGVRKFGSTVETETKHFKELGSTVKSLTGLLAKELFDAAQASMRFGSEFNLIRSRLAGMAPEDYSQMQAENRQAINALTGNFNEFDSLISKSNLEMIQYTGSLKDSSKLIGSLITTSRLIGNAGIETDKFVESQKKMFTSFNRQLSMTSDEFAAMNDRLIQDSDIRGVLYRQSEQERQAHFEDLQMQVKTYRTWGLLQDQAESLAKTMDRMAGRDAKTRMKEAARLRSVMGAIGMAQEGARAQALILKGSRRTGAETEELAGIRKSANEVVSGLMGDTFANELLISAMIQKASLEELLGPNSIMVNALLGKGAAAKNPIADAAEAWMSNIDVLGIKGSEIINTITGFKEVLISFLGSSFIAGLVTAFTVSSFGRGLVGLAKKGGSMLAGGVGRTGVAMGATSRLGALAAGGTGITAAAMMGKDVYDLATGETTNENMYAVGGGLIGGAIGLVGGPIGAAIGVAAGNYIGEKIGKYLDSLDEPSTELAKMQKDQNDKLIAAMEKMQDAIESGNEVAIATAQNTLQTQLAIINQTKSQTENAEKAREQEKTKLRQLYIHSSRSVSTTSPR